MNRKPTGFIATCQCGRVVGAMDHERTSQPDAGHLLGYWLSKGCTVSPKFEHNWSTSIEPCECASQSREPPCPIPGS